MYMYNYETYMHMYMFVQLNFPWNQAVFLSSFSSCVMRIKFLAILMCKILVRITNYPSNGNIHCRVYILCVLVAAGELRGFSFVLEFAHLPVASFSTKAANKTFSHYPCRTVALTVF